MGGKSSPKTPDYVGAANAEAAASKEATTANTWANRPTVTTPWGTQSWSTGTTRDPATGQNVTTWNQNIQLTPAQQQALNSQQAIQQGQSQAAQQLLGQATSSTASPMNWGQLPQGGQTVQAGQLQTSLSSDPSQVRQQAQDAVYKLQQPYIQQQRGALESQLANQGITPGSEAYNNAMRQQGDAESRAQLQAIQAGQSEAQQLFGQNLQTAQFGNQAQMQQLQGQLSAGGYNNQNRQQAISEALAQRSQPLNELNALLTGNQVSSPNFPSFSQAGTSQTPQLLQAANLGYQSSLDQYNAQQGQFGNLLGGASSLVGATMPYFMAFSDRRLKKNVRKLGELDGVNVYEYEYIWGGPKQVGVMAQEVPHASVVHPSGYLMVDYSRIWN